MEVDTTLVPGDGGFKPARALGDVMFSDGGDKSLAQLSEGGVELAWKWMRTLPAPDINDSTATYRGAVDGGGDLVVTATATGFSHSIVLHAPPSGSVDYTVPVVTHGGDILETPQGGLIVEAANGEPLVEAAVPIMWDSGKDARGEPDVEIVETTIGQTVGGTPTITLSPDDDFLHDPNTTYPVTIDPYFTAFNSGDTWIESPGFTSSQGSSEELRVGTQDGGAHKARSFIRFGTTNEWVGKQILSANLMLWNFSSPSCSAGTVRVSRITEDWSISGLTWSNQPVVSADQADFSSAYGGSACAAAYATWDVTSIVQAWASGSVNQGVRVKAVDETANNTYRRYRSDNYAGYPPKIVVNYNTPPSIPTTPVITPGGPGYTTSGMPSFSVTSVDPESNPTTFIFKLEKTGLPVWEASEPGTLASGAQQVANVTLPLNLLDPGVQYTMRVTAVDSLGAVSATRSLEFQSDTAAPTVPAPACTAPCQVATGPIYPATGYVTLQPGEARTIDLSGLPNFDDFLTVQLLISTNSASASGTLSLYNPDYSIPRSPTLAYSSGATSTTLELLPSDAGTVAVQNGGSGSVQIRISEVGWTPWLDASEMALEAAEGAPVVAPAIIPTPVEGPGFDVGPAEPSSLTAEPGVTYLWNEALSTDACSNACLADNTPGSVGESGCAVNDAGWTTTSRHTSCHVQRLKVTQGLQTISYSVASRLTAPVTSPGSPLLNLETTMRLRKVLGTALTGFRVKLVITCVLACTKGPDDMYVLDIIDDPVTHANSITTGIAAETYANQSLKITLKPQVQINGDEWQNATPITYSTRIARCDWHVTFNPYQGGCVFPEYVGVFSQSDAPGRPGSKTASHAFRAITQLGLPGVGLQRTTNVSTMRSSRRIAVRICKSRGAAPAGFNCDEYPFRSTHQGCRPRKTAGLVPVCSAVWVPEGDNSSQGGLLSHFYAYERMAHYDPFRVTITHQ
jgi:hypothetical protein